MANNTDLAALLNIDKLNKDIDILRGKIKEITVDMSQLLKAGGSNSEATDAIKKHNAATRELSQAIKILEQNINSLTPAQKEFIANRHQESLVTKTAVNDFKLQATAMNMTASAYERLKAQSALATNAALEAGAKLEFAKRAAVVDADAVNKLQLEYARLSKIAQETAHSLTRLEQETGKVTPRTMSAYSATFSLTQVMRELPNFAQSARIGFMSLSNNLPMLADDFRRLSKEVNGLTGKANGFSGALKIFSKELIGFNAIVILATTLITIYGESIVKWVKEMWKGVDVTESMTLSQKALYDQMSTMNNETHSTAKRISVLGVMIEKYKDGVGNAQYIVKEYNETLGVHHGKLDDINKVMDVYQDQARQYIEWTVAMNAATEQAGKASDQMLRAKSNEQKISLFPKKDAEEAEALIVSFGKIKNKLGLKGQTEDLLGLSEYSLNLKGIYDKELVDTSKAINSFDENLVKAIIEKRKALFASEAYKKSAIELMPDQFIDDKNGSGSGARTKQLREQYEKEVYYNKARAMLIEDNKRLEMEIEKERTDGTQNTFEERFDALTLYYQNIQRIAEIDLEKAKKIADEKYKDKSSKADAILENNLKKFKEGSKEYEIAVEQHEQVKAALKYNYDAALMEADDAYWATINDNTRNYLQENLKIRTDFYEEENRLAKIRSEQAGIEFDQKQADEKLAQMKAEHDKINDIFVSSDNRNRQREIDSFRASQDLLKFNAEQEVKYAEEKLKRAEKGSVDQKNALDELFEALRKQRKVYADIEYNDAVFQQKRINELKEQLEVESVNALKTIEEEYFKWHQDKLDKQADRLKKINDEEQKQNEDKLKAGVISEQQAEDAKKRIADYGLMQQEEIARQKKELERKQFLLEKNIALAEITINTAVAIAKAGTNYAEIIAAAAVGTVQTVAVVATMFPEYKDGTRDFKGGYAKVNDGGVPEVIKEPNKEPYILNGKDVISYFPQGTDIYRSVDEARNNGVIRDENISIQRKLDRLVFTNVNNFNDNRIVNEISGLRMDMRKLKSRGSNGLKIARDYRDKLNGIA